MEGVFCVSDVHKWNIQSQSYVKVMCEGFPVKVSVRWQIQSQSYVWWVSCSQRCFMYSHHRKCLLTEKMRLSELTYQQYYLGGMSYYNIILKFQNWYFILIVFWGPVFSDAGYPRTSTKHPSWWEYHQGTSLLQYRPGNVDFPYGHTDPIFMMATVTIDLPQQFLHLPVQNFSKTIDICSARKI
jgi:hypothetical protein